MQLQQILQETETIKQGDGSIAEENENDPGMEASDDEMDPDLDDDEDEDEDDDDDSQDMEGEQGKKPKIPEEEHVFDVAYELQSQIKEYKTISEIFRKNKVPYAER